MIKSSYLFFLLLFLFLGISALGQTIISKDGKFGVLDEDNSIAVEPIYDTLFVPPFVLYRKDGSLIEVRRNRKTNEKYLKLYLAKKGDTYGYIMAPFGDRKDWVESPTIYSSILLNAESGMKLILKDTLGYTHIDLVPTYIQLSAGGIFQESTRNKIETFTRYEAHYDSLFPANDKESMGFVKEGKFGLIRAGEQLVEPLYEEPLFVLNDSLVFACMNDKWGVLKNGEVVIPFNYEKDALELDKNNPYLLSFNHGKILQFIPLNNFKIYTVTRSGKEFIYDDKWHYNLIQYTTDLTVITGEIRKRDESLKDSKFSYLSRDFEDHMVVYDSKMHSEILNFHKPNCFYAYEQDVHLIREMECGPKELKCNYYEAYTGKLAFELVVTSSTRYFPYELRNRGEYWTFDYTSGNKKGEIYRYVDKKTYKMYKSQDKLTEALK